MSATISNISFLVITSFLIRAFGIFSTHEILEKSVIVKGKVCYVNFTQQLLISYLCWNSPRWRIARRQWRCGGGVKWALDNFIFNYQLSRVPEILSHLWCVSTFMAVAGRIFNVASLDKLCENMLLLRASPRLRPAQPATWAGRSCLLTRDLGDRNLASY